MENVGNKLFVFVFVCTIHVQHTRKDKKINYTSTGRKKLN